MEEVRGRTLLDEDSIIEMPVVVQEGLICVPGQTLPLTISHPHIMAMMRRVIEGNHIFGILSFRLEYPFLKNYFSN
jgi:cereblon